MARNSEERRRLIARNFIKQYGKETFRAFLAGTTRDESGASWGRRLGVSRERVRQWRSTLSTRIVYIAILPDVLEVLLDSTEKGE